MRRIVSGTTHHYSGAGRAQGPCRQVACTVVQVVHSPCHHGQTCTTVALSCIQQATIRSELRIVACWMQDRSATVMHPTGHVSSDRTCRRRRVLGRMGCTTNIQPESPARRRGCTSPQPESPARVPSPSWAGWDARVPSRDPSESGESGSRIRANQARKMSGSDPSESGSEDVGYSPCCQVADLRRVACWMQDSAIVLHPTGDVSSDSLSDETRPAGCTTNISWIVDLGVQS